VQQRRDARVVDEGGEVGAVMVGKRPASDAPVCLALVQHELARLAHGGVQLRRGLEFVEEALDLAQGERVLDDAPSRGR
jgi:hypothetical protein